MRVGVMLDSTSELKPVVSLAVARDGGLMLTPAEIRTDGWSYGVAEVPGGVDSGLLGHIPREGIVHLPERPKLHYHRSGFTSVNLAGKDYPRRSVRCLPLPQMRGDQCFGIQVDGVEALPTKDVRSRDAVLVVQRWPARVSVYGLLYQRGQIPGLLTEFGSDTATGLVRSRAVELVTDLAAHGLDAALVLRFSSQPAQEPMPEPGISLFGFDYRVALPMMTDTVGIWTTRRRPEGIPVLPPAYRPKFRFEPGGISLDRHTITRERGKGRITQQQF